ncbi:MAG: hypothetical protein KF862_13205 [Chitinophagaceae bacterium]|nr:hypothetical protein [Chitinophagaceae bacterium]
MKTSLTILLLHAYFSWSWAQAQPNKIPETSFSHIYFTIDPAGYSAFSKNKFFTDTLFYYSAGSMKTDQGSWNGQYLEGAVDYWEVFQPDTISKMSIGDIGLGFMLHQPYAVHAFRNHWQQQTSDRIQTEAFTENSGKDTIIVEIMNYRDSMLTGGPSSFFALYYHPSVLEKANFRTEDIQSGINQEAIHQKIHGSVNNKPLYKKTEKIFLRLTPHEYERHRVALKAFGYQEKSKQHFKKDIEIAIELDTKPAHRLQKIEFSLTGKTENRRIAISPGLFLSVSGEKGELVWE